MNRFLCSLASVLAFCFTTCHIAGQPAGEKKAEAKDRSYVRVERDAKGQPTTLQTAIVRFVPAKGDRGVSVDLVGAVHVGDRDYYDELNKLFESYDVVLYELVAPPGTRIPKGGRREKDNPLAFIQRLMKTAMELESQTESIDYTKKNFVHADLSPDQMLDRIRERGDDAVTIALGIAVDLLRQQNRQQPKPEKKPSRTKPEVDLTTLFFDPEGPKKMKRMLAENFADADAVNAGLGQTLNTILISDRNEAAMKVFQKELAAGKKKIAIFYGAAHMPDFEKRLTSEFGLHRSSEKWLTAWELD
jgi:hypothetical protein